MHASAASGSAKFSPSLRAISRIDRSIIIVETGTSKGSEERPNAPPAAPDATANALCSITELSRPRLRIVLRAIFAAICKLFAVALAIACDAPGGKALPMRSIGLPSMLVRRAAKLGTSSHFTALRSASMSVCVRDSIIQISTSIVFSPLAIGRHAADETVFDLM